MKMLLFLGLFLCISSAAGLQCLTCTNTTCSATVSMNCTSEQTMCISAKAALQLTGTLTQILKGCVPALVCPRVGNQSFSLEFGSVSVQAYGECCNTDNCNAATPNVTAPPAGSLQCYSCNPLTNNCTSVTCNTLETQCFSTQVQAFSGFPAVSAYGCISPNLCNPTILSYLPLVNFTFAAATSCCNTTNCNAPPTATAPPTTSFNSTNTTASTSSAVGPALPLGLLRSLLGLLLIMLYF